MESVKKRSRLENFKGKRGALLSKENQPSPEKKKAGWLKRKSLIQLLQLGINNNFTLKTKGVNGVPQFITLRKHLSNMLGVHEDALLNELSFETAMDLMQIKKAILEADTYAWEKLKDRAHGKPDQKANLNVNLNTRVEYILPSGKIVTM